MISGGIRRWSGRIVHIRARLRAIARLPTRGDCFIRMARQRLRAEVSSDMFRHRADSEITRNVSLERISVSREFRRILTIRQLLS